LADLIQTRPVFAVWRHRQRKTAVYLHAVAALLERDPGAQAW
jgi:hypothetical protein